MARISKKLLNKLANLGAQRMAIDPTTGQVPVRRAIPVTPEPEIRKAIPVTAEPEVRRAIPVNKEPVKAPSVEKTVTPVKVPDNVTPVAQPPKQQPPAETPVKTEKPVITGVPTQLPPHVGPEPSINRPLGVPEKTEIAKSKPVSPEPQVQVKLPPEQGPQAGGVTLAPPPPAEITTPPPAIAYGRTLLPPQNKLQPNANPQPEPQLNLETVNKGPVAPSPNGYDGLDILRSGVYQPKERWTEAPIFPKGKLPHTPTQLQLPSDSSLSPAEMNNQLLQRIPGGADSFVAEQRANYEKLKDKLPYGVDWSRRDQQFPLTLGGDDSGMYHPKTESISVNPALQKYVYGNKGNSADGWPGVSWNNFSGYADNAKMPADQTAWAAMHEGNHAFLQNVAPAGLVANLTKFQRTLNQKQQQSLVSKGFKPEDKFVAPGALRAPTYNTTQAPEYLQGALSGLNTLRDVTGRKMNTPAEIHQVFTEIEKNPAILDKMPPEGARIFRDYIYKVKSGDEMGAEALREAIARDSQFLAQNQQQAGLKTAGFYDMVMKHLRNRNQHEKTAADTVIVSGIHGDEPAAAIAGRQLASKGLPVVDVGNHSGKRTDHGIDLNRHFDDANKPPKLVSALRKLVALHPKQIIDLHEDNDAHGAYAYASHDIADRVRQKLNAGKALGQAKSVKGDKAVQGVITDGKYPPKGSIEKVMENKGISYTTVETPTNVPLSERVAFHKDKVEKLKKAAGLEKQLKAVLIKGNPKYIDRPRPRAFYTAVRKLLERAGYTVTEDAGHAYTVPAAADLWVGHSRGVDRLRFAPPETRTLGLGAPPREGIQVLNHPKDPSSIIPLDRFHKGVCGKELEALPGYQPGFHDNAAHFKITPEMRAALLKTK